MLSIENPPPPHDSDPPHPCQLKKKKFSNLPHLDPSLPPSSSSSLLSSSLDNHHSTSNINPKYTPNFSIRDYVFAVRNKDVKKNWPFSLENLQLCFKHGVKDPLPPFQTIDSVKNQSSRRCTAEAVTDVQTKLDDAPAIKRIADHTRKSNPGSENELPVTSTSVHQSEIESLEANQSSLNPSAVKIPPLLSRTENTNKPTAKKCRIVVKFGSVSAEDIASNLTTASEHMASSKTCPVCKKFSSSSNTTLNAHIDQCLASGSKPVLTPGSRSFSHKIKPRKIRLMKDVYTTAKECTLEELDSRNGISWAGLNSNVSGFDTEISDGVPEEAENQRSSPDCSISKDIEADQAPVYVDANGTKVRILSKLDDDATMATKTIKNKNVMGTKQLIEGGKGGKIFSSKKKSRHGKKRQKYLKLVPQSTKLLPQKAYTSQAPTSPEGYSQENNPKKEERRVAKQAKKPVSSPATSKQWMPLKYTTTAKELNKKGCRRNPPSEYEERCLQNLSTRRNQVEKVTGCSGNKEGNIESRLLPVKRSSDHLRIASNSAQHSPISRSAEKSRICASSVVRKRICSSTAFGKPVKETPALGSRTLKVLPAGKKVSIRLQSAVDQELNAGKRCFSSKTRPQLLHEGDKGPVARETSIGEECSIRQNVFENHHDGEMVPEDTSHLLQEEPVALQSSRVMVSQYHRLGDEQITGSSARVPDLCDDETDSFSDSDSDDDDDDDDDVLENYDDHEITEERATSGLSRFLSSEFIKRNHSETPFDSSQSLDEYTGASSEGQALFHQSEPCFLGGQEVYSSHVVGNVISDQAAYMDIELDSETGQDCFFPEVEPIPIPGPPGSFLPSPRDMMTSDDFPGHSSLTTSPVRSSEDHCDLIDRISSDSPVSMASTVSNSNIAGRYDHMKYFEQLSLGGMALGQKKNLDSVASSVEVDRNFENERFRYNGIAVDKKPFGFSRGDDQPCCCQRKERPSQGYISLNFQESQLLKRRTMTNSERQVDVVPNTKPGAVPDITVPCNSHMALISEPEALPSIPKKKPFLEEPCVLKPSFDTYHTSSSPSGSNPVLRLMGKNLMVINVEEDASTHLSHGDLASKPLVQLSVPSLHHTAPRGSFLMNHDTRDASDRRTCFGSKMIPQAPQNPAQGMLQNHETVPLSLLKPQEPPLQHEAHELHKNDHFNAIPLKRANTSPIRLSSTPEGSGKMHESSLMAASPSATHLGSSLFYS